MKQPTYYGIFGAFLLANLSSVVIAENESDELWNSPDHGNDTNEKEVFGFQWENPNDEENNGEIANLTGNKRWPQKLHRERGGSSYDLFEKLPESHDGRFKSHTKDKKKDPKKKDPKHKHKKDPPKKKKHSPKDVASKLHHRGPGRNTATMIIAELPEMPHGTSKTYNKDKKKHDKKKDPKNKKDPKHKKDPPKKKKQSPKDTPNKVHFERGPIHGVASRMAALPEMSPEVSNKTYNKDKKKDPKKDPKKKEDPKHKKKDPKHKKKKADLRRHPTNLKFQRDEQYKWLQGNMVVDTVVNVTTGNCANDDSLPELNENSDAAVFLHASSA